MRRGRWVWIFVTIGALGVLAVPALVLTSAARALGKALQMAAEAGAGEKNEAPAVASYEACKPAWRVSRDALARMSGREAAVKALDALIVTPADGWAADAGAEVPSTGFGPCAPDAHGAWALTVRTPEVPKGKRACGEFLLELQRLSNDGKALTIPVDFLNEEGGDCDSQLGNVPYYLADSVKLAQVADMNQDGVPEVTLTSSGGPFDHETTELFTSYGGKVAHYPGTEDISITKVADRTGDGRPDVYYHYLYAATAPNTGCGVRGGGFNFSPELIAIPGAKGALDFDAPEAHALARRLCPGAPDNPEEDVLCTLIWGNQGNGIPDYGKLQKQCYAKYAAADARAEKEARKEQGTDDDSQPCIGYPSQEACGDHDGWDEFAKTKLRISFWPPAGAEKVTRSDANNAAISAAHEAFERARQAMGHKDWDAALASYREAAEHTDEPELVEGEMAYAQLRGGDQAGAEKAIASFVDGMTDPQAKAASLYNLGLALEARGEQRGAARAFFRSNRLHPTKDARAKLGKSPICPADIVVEKSGISLAAWEKTAGALEDSPSEEADPGDYHWKRMASKEFTEVEAYRFAAGKRDAVYKLDPSTGRVSQCLVARGCTCTAASPCAGGLRPAPAPMREWALFDTASGHRVASVTWPADAAPKGVLSAKEEKGSIVVTGAGCSEKVMLDR